MNLLLKASHTRLDTALSIQLDISRAKLKKLFQHGAISTGGRLLKPSFMVTHDIDITIEMDATPPNVVSKDTLQSKEIDVLPSPLDLLYEDKDILVLNKPLGLITHGVETFPDASSVVTQLQSMGVALARTDNELRPGIVHRLDKNTEGIMVVSKTKASLEHLKSQFKKRVVKKRYYAMVKGDMAHDHGTITYPIGRHPTHRKKRWVLPTHPEAKEAITEYRVIKRFKTKTLLDVTLLTGRTHQIRVHLAYLGHPIIGDSEYGEASKKQPTQLLQAYYLSFTHPTNKKLVTWSFTLPMSKRFLQ